MSVTFQLVNYLLHCYVEIIEVAICYQNDIIGLLNVGVGYIMKVVIRGDISQV